VVGTTGTPKERASHNIGRQGAQADISAPEYCPQPPLPPARPRSKGHCYIGKVFRETEKAMLVSFAGARVWLPKSLTFIVKSYSKNEHLLWVPDWIAERGKFRSMAQKREV
jgi:hypothetical protein